MNTRAATPPSLNLQAFVAATFGVCLPCKAFTEGHSTPLAFVTEAFWHPSRDVAAWACRSGGKTLSASLLAALEFLRTDGLQARVLSGSENQSRNLYDYWRRWCGTKGLARRLSGPIRRGTTNLVADGRLEILSASQRDVRGPKVHRLFEDELDEIDPEIDAAAVGMIASAPGIPGRTIYTSTWHRTDGPMARLVEGCPANGVSLHKWNIWEAIQQCTPARHRDGGGCDHCPLSGPCVAKAREHHDDPTRTLGIATEACGFCAIDDVIKAYSKISLRAWQAEYECKRPVADGRVYPEFDPHLHRRPAPPAGLTIYRAIDWGSTVFVCLWLGADARGRSWLLDTYRAEQGTVHQHAEYIRRHRLRNIRETFCDPAGRNRNDQTGRSNVEIFRSYGIHCTYATGSRDREVRNGIGLVRAALAPADGRPRLFYVPSEANGIFVKAMGSYKNRKVNGVYIDQPVDPQEFEHIPDALRYYIVNRTRDRGVTVARFGAS